MNQRLALKKKALEERLIKLKKAQNYLRRDSTKLFRPLDPGKDCSHENAILNIINYNKPDDENVNSSGNLLPVGSKTHTLIDKSDISEEKLRNAAEKGYAKASKMKDAFSRMNKNKAYF